MYRMQRGKQVGLSQGKELDSKVYTKLSHERLWVPGTLLKQSGTPTAMELGDRKTVRRHTNHVRSCPTNRVTVEDSNESLENHEETNSDTPQAILVCDEPIAVRKLIHAPKPIDRFVSGQ
ncbi:unnamed protein product [Echinostoma caproni]|uniref:Uncharacterized protein n=1 Tax=Echinostoma caproni TaxID=27848 RepID=A0A183B9V5_9TREM|nr:unnamed protein product [Echinostoma caproni]